MRRRKIRRAVIAMIGLIMVIVMLVKADAIYNEFTKIRDIASEKILYQSMHKRKANLENRVPLQDENGKWYTKYRFVAHAGGR